MRKLQPCAISMMLLAAGAALAQSASPDQAPPDSTTVTTTTTAQPGTEAQVQATRPVYTGPEIRVLGIPVRMGSPVSPPYAPNAFETYAGQPKTGLDQVLSQDSGSEPRTSGAQFPGGDGP